MNSDIIIRDARIEDSKVIADFQLAMALETENLILNKKILEKGVEAVFLDSTKGKYYVAEQNNTVIGSLLTTYEWSDWRNSTVLWIQSVYVKQEFRKLGVFKMLYNHINSIWKSDDKYAGIRLYVDKTNKKAINVYNKVGMNGEHYQLFENM